MSTNQPLKRNIQEIELIMRRGFASLGVATHLFWPGRYADKGEKDNEMKEKNISFHVANAFAENGSFVYPEVPFMYKDKKSSLDYLIIDCKSKYMLSIEAKRLYSAEKAKSMANDYDRINKFDFLDPEYNKKFSDFYYYGLLFATTWDMNIANWWISNNEYPENCKAKGWEKLNNLPDADEYHLWGRQPIFEETDEDPQNYGLQYALYFLFRCEK